MRKDRGLTKEGKWVYGDLLHIAKRTFITQSPPEAKCILDFTYAEVIPETVGQSTGLKDKKRTEEYPEGQEISEGDIVARDPDKMRGVVVWKDNRQAFIFDLQNGHFVFTSMWSSIEIIGNIHQDPELIEEGK